MTGYNFGGGQAKDKRSLVLRLRKDDPTSEFSCTVAGAVVNDPPPIGALVTVKVRGVGEGAARIISPVTRNTVL